MNLRIEKPRLSLVRPVSFRDVEIAAVHIHSFGPKRVTAQTEVYETAVVAFAPPVSFLTDSNAQGLLLGRVEPVTEEIDMHPIQPEVACSGTLDLD